MTQEDKELLVKDLCSRLPYGVKCQYTCVVQEGTLVTGKSNWIGELKGIVPLSDGHIGFMVDCDKIDALEGDIKPYLRLMSSMTEEEKEKLKSLYDAENVTNESICFHEGGTLEEYEAEISFIFCYGIVVWLLENHFDYIGLIKKGLAIEVTEENNPYKEE